MYEKEREGVIELFPKEGFRMGLVLFVLRSPVAMEVVEILCHLDVVQRHLVACRFDHLGLVSVWKGRGLRSVLLMVGLVEFALR